jgi:hypothetical protein
VRDLLADRVADLRFERRTLAIEADSSAAWVDDLERALAPIVVAKSVLEPAGAWEPARADLIALYDEVNEAKDGSLRARGEYLLTVATR